MGNQYNPFPFGDDVIQVTWTSLPWNLQDYDEGDFGPTVMKLESLADIPIDPSDDTLPEPSYIPTMTSNGPCNPQWISHFDRFYVRRFRHHIERAENKSSRNLTTYEPLVVEHGHFDPRLKLGPFKPTFNMNPYREHPRAFKPTTA